MKESITRIRETDENIDERRYSWMKGQVAQAVFETDLTAAETPQRVKIYVVLN